MYDISTSINIAAPPIEVWKVLMDLASWSEWNTFVTSIKVEGAGQTLSIGSQQVIAIVPDPAKANSPETYSNFVTEIEENKRLVWRGTLVSSLVFSTEHWCTLDPVRAEDGGSEETMFSQGESFSGLLSPVVGMMGKPEQLRQGYTRMNQDLKQRVESEVLRMGQPAKAS